MDFSALKLGVVLSGKLSSQRNSFKVWNSSAIVLRVSTFLSRELPHHEPCHTASCRLVFVLEKQILQRSGSGNLTVKFRLYGPIGKECQLKLWVFLLKKQTFVMSYYIELRCSSFFSTVRSDFSNSMMCELLTNAECWFPDYSATEITLVFLTISLLQVQIHPLPCLVLLSPLTRCWNYLSQLLEPSLGLQEA